MSKKNGIVALSRRSFLRSAATISAAAVAAPAFAQSALSDIINAPSRGTWDDQFDAKSASRTASVAVSNTPILSPDSVANIQQAIAQYQAIAANGGWPQVNVTPDSKLQLGASDPVVQSLRQRLMITGDLPREAGMSQAFDSYVDGAVKRFQARHGLPADGALGQYTIKALNITADVRLQQLNTNLIRLQTFPADLGRRHVMVNIPATYVEAVQDGEVALRHMAIVGRMERPTHIINSKIFEVILNPYWTAPRSIIQKDIVPLMRKDPTYLTKNNIRLFDPKGTEIPPETVDWNADKAPNLMFRQDPGKNNAMASTKINFYNPNNEYMHDTPEQGLFNKLMRFDSSGCVRVQNVRDLAVWLLAETPDWQRQHIESVIASRVNTPIKLPEEVPVYFAYISAWAMHNNVVQFRDDIYQLDGNAQLALDTTQGMEQPVQSLAQ